VRVFRCDFCSTEVEDYEAAKWFQLWRYTGERSSDLWHLSDKRGWMFCSPTCLGHFAELESVRGR